MCVGNLTIIVSDNGLSTGQRQAITWPMLAYCQLDSCEHISVKFELAFYHFHSGIIIWKCRLPKWRPLFPGGDELRNGWRQYICRSIAMRYMRLFNSSTEKWRVNKAKCQIALHTRGNDMKQLLKQATFPALHCQVINFCMLLIFWRNDSDRIIMRPDWT